jgi:predicted transcriptional regulator
VLERAPATADELTETLGLANTTVNAYLRRAHQVGKLVRRREQSDGPYAYWIPNVTPGTTIDRS